MTNRPAAALAWVSVLLTLPLLAGAWLYAFGAPQLAGVGLLTLLSLSATLLAFLGGVRMGVEIGRSSASPSAIVVALVTPAAAWLLLALPFFEPTWQFAGLLALHLVMGLWDATSDLPKWWKTPRMAVAVVTVVALAMGMWKGLAGG